MRHKGRHERGRDKAHDGVDPRQCDHVWRDRAITFALPDSCLCEVCDRCGALHIAGAEGVSGNDAAPPRPSPLRDAGGVGLESLARRWSRRAGGAPSSAD